MKKSEVKSLAREALRNREKEARKEIEYKYRAWEKEIAELVFFGSITPVSVPHDREALEVYEDYKRDIAKMEAEIIAASKELEAV